MKLDTTAAEQTMFAIAELSHGKPDSRAQPCPQAEDDNSAAKYLYELSRDVILFLDRTGKILCINPCGIQPSGYLAEELRGGSYVAVSITSRC
jgi:hypothetical protein